MRTLSLSNDLFTRSENTPSSPDTVPMLPLGIPILTYDIGLLFSVTIFPFSTSQPMLSLAFFLP